MASTARGELPSASASIYAGGLWRDCKRKVAARFKKGGFSHHFTCFQSSFKFFLAIPCFSDCLVMALRPASEAQSLCGCHLKHSLVSLTRQ